MNADAAQRYRDRLGRVLHHVDAHLDDDLSVEMLSGIAAFSKYHFHRQFTALFGIGVYKYVQLARLKRASHRLAFRDTDAITTIALDSGYDGPEAFARAFKRTTGQSPSEFRRQPDWTPWHAAFQPLSATRKTHMPKSFDEDRVTIVDFKDTRVAAFEHRGDPALIGDSIRQFIAWRKAAGLPPRLSATFNILYGDPDDTPPEDFRLDICCATERTIAPDDTGIVAKTIPGGRCAVLRYVGGDDHFRDAIIYLYGVWLAQSGEEPRDFPLFCQRITLFPDVPENEATTDIFLPLK